MKDKSGIALILAIGILAILAVIATSFALNMRLEYKAAVNYYNSVKMRYLGDAALHRAIIELKEHVKQNAFDDLDQDWAAGYSENISSTAASTIEDEQRKINVNNASQALLRNLFIDRLELTSSSADDLYSTIQANREYNSLEELKSKEVLTDAQFDAIKGDITVYSYVDGSTGRSPINVNTCEEDILIANLRGLGGIYDGTQLGVIAAAIMNNRPFDKWIDFDNCINNLTIITTEQAELIIDNCNPNHTVKPANHTTEFCFHSGGVYKIKAKGTIGPDPNNPIAERTVTAIVKIYEIYNDSVFYEDTNHNGVLDAGEDRNGNGVLDIPASYERVTWLDSCPVNSTDLFGSYLILSNPQTIPGSLKLGCWDNFDSNAQEGNRFYSQAQWTNETFQTLSGDDKLITAGGTRCDLVGNDSEWEWTDFSLRVWATEYNPNPSQMKDVAWIKIRNDETGPAPEDGNPAILHTRSAVLSWDQTGYGRYAYYQTGYGDVIDPDTHRVEFWTPAEAVSNLGYYTENDAINGRHHYDTGQLRIFSNYRNGSPPYFESENYESSDYKSDFLHVPTKTFNIIADATNITAAVWTTTGSTTTLTRDIPGVNTSGGIALYGNNVDVGWDRIRIISPTGSFTSQIIIPTGSDVEWGTITGTITHPNSSLVSPTLEGNIRIRTTVGGLSTGNPEAILYDPTNPDNRVLAIRGTARPSIQYKVFLEQNAADTDMKETPVLEDITITYLPKTEILSYSLSD